MRWESCDINFGEIGLSPEWYEGYSDISKDCTKRAISVRQTLLPHFLNKIKNATSKEEIIEYVNMFVERIQPLMEIIYKTKNAKALYIMWQVCEDLRNNIYMFEKRYIPTLSEQEEKIEKKMIHIRKIRDNIKKIKGLS